MRTIIKTVLLFTILASSACTSGPALPLPTETSLPPATQTPLPPSPTTTPIPSDTPTQILIPTETLAPSPTPAPTRTPKPGQTVWRGDLHMHTKCSDGINSYEEMVQRALELNLDFIAITDHNSLDSYDRKNCHAYTAQCLAETRLTCITGEELGIFGPHLVVLGLANDAYRTPPKSIEDKVARAQAVGGMAIAAHPNNSDNPYKTNELIQWGFDAMECGKGEPEQIAAQDQLSIEYNLPCVYSSDAHSTAEMGEYVTECSVAINSLADLLSAVKSGLCHQGK